MLYQLWLLAGKIFLKCAIIYNYLSNFDILFYRKKNFITIINIQGVLSETVIIYFNTCTNLLSLINTIKKNDQETSLYQYKSCFQNAQYRHCLFLPCSFFQINYPNVNISAEPGGDLTFEVRWTLIAIRLQNWTIWYLGGGGKSHDV